MEDEITLMLDDGKIWVMRWGKVKLSLTLEEAEKFEKDLKEMRKKLI